MAEEEITGFGQALRQQRQAAGMRQVDLVEALGRVIARSTLANVEVGREKASARLWEAICRTRPDWVDALQPWYRSTRPHAAPPFELGGPYELLEARDVYTFREHRAPEEIVMLRRVRCLADGADGYGLSLGSASGTFAVDTEPLFGGWIERHDEQGGNGATNHLTRFHFDHALAPDEEHEFATRSWVSHDLPDRHVALRVIQPTREARIVLNFLGPRPQLVWRFSGSEPDAACTGPAREEDLVTADGSGPYTLALSAPEPWRLHGLAWQW